MRTLFLSRLLRAVRLRYVAEIINWREGLGESRTGARQNVVHLLANKHQRLRDSKFGRVEVWASSCSKRIKTKRKYILHTIKKTISITLSVYLCFNNVWQVKITWRYCRLRDSKLAECIDPLHKWRLNLNNNTWYILSLTFMKFSHECEAKDVWVLLFKFRRHLDKGSMNCKRFYFIFFA